MPLDERGKIAAAEIGFYVPIAAITIVLMGRYALRRDAGWLFLFLHSLVRIANGALLLAGQLVEPTMITLFRAAYALDVAAPAFLSLAIIGFLGLVGQHSFSESNRTIRSFRVIAILALAALAISVAGAVQSNDPSSESAQNIGKILREVGAITYAALWVILFVTHLVCYSYRYHLRPERRPLLRGITLALLFLGTRAAYSILNAWSADDELGLRPSSNPTLRRFNTATGNWIPWLVMDIIMEYGLIVICLLASTIIPRRWYGRF
ncbi:hypothetical protein BDN71DRAFT_1443866 [Pleurotus eryngii]|uniref:DUF7702 domain-containing protein n=1 Tax=Pleurotus eryngii TaxID=5323 RepID=A0A9P6A6M7_PLEER|nr:hypothetical protein BDN71DRAFT_1443866 [Pleurotus eryngii]